jgi:hypothetical protein
MLAVDAVAPRILNLTDGRPSEILTAISRDEIIGTPTYWRVSNLGVVQAAHGYDRDLMQTILRKALALKEEYALKRHLNLRYIRSAQRLIPEIDELVHDQRRLEKLSTHAGTELEPYPISVIGSIITFMGPESGGGGLAGPCDGGAGSELLPQAIEDRDGGELELFQGHSDHGLALVAGGQPIPGERIRKVPHRMGYSTLGQFLRVLHRTAPIRRGWRVTLNLNLRSRDRSFIDDNSLVYLGADNPDFTWTPELVRDVQQHQLPAYKAFIGAS